MSTPDAFARLDWDKDGGLLPAVVQHALDGRVLMLGYMNREALAATQASGRVTFYSRSKQRLWMKGESSGHVLQVERISVDCDHDTLLVLALPHGPTCHTGADTCFHDDPQPAATSLAFLARLEQVIAARVAAGGEGSYTAKLFAAGPKRMAQKVGEEGLEVAIAALAEDDAALIGESADLLFHLAVVLKSRGLSLSAVADELARRHASSTGSAAQ